MKIYTKTIFWLLFSILAGETLLGTVAYGRSGHNPFNLMAADGDKPEGDKTDPRDGTCCSNP